MGFRTDVSFQTSNAAITSSATVSVGLTITGQTGKSICVTHLSTWYTTAQQVNQMVKLFDGATLIYQEPTLAGIGRVFVSPIRISESANCVATTSVSVNTITGFISLGYYTA